MGYITSYKLKTKGNTDLISQFVEENEYAAYALESNGSTNESCKWYEHEEDCKAFSLKYPETLFELTGEGEESGDIWVKYFKGGKMQVCKAQIVFPLFDHKLLK